MISEVFANLDGMHLDDLKYIYERLDLSNPSCNLQHYPGHFDVALPEHKLPDLCFLHHPGQWSG